jgi:hypothetical protein
MTAKTTLSDLDVAAKFLLGLFAFLGFAAAVAVLGGCSSAPGPAPLCKAGKHAVYLKSEHATACVVDGTADPCGNGTDCTSGCCDAVNGDLTNRRCVDDVSADPNGFCVCAGGGDSACPVGTTCQSLPQADECVVSEGVPDAGPEAAPLPSGCTLADPVMYTCVPLTQDRILQCTSQPPGCGPAAYAANGTAVPGVYCCAP